jgi:hypothetical protein
MFPNMVGSRHGMQIATCQIWAWLWAVANCVVSLIVVGMMDDVIGREPHTVMLLPYKDMLIARADCPVLSISTPHYP